jgi:hypothetical protein
MTRRPRFILRQEPDGQWRCRSPIIDRISVVAATPNEAVAKMQLTLKDFRAFRDHSYGRCQPTDCEYCRVGKRPRGAWKLIPATKPKETTDAGTESDLASPGAAEQAGAD